MTGLQGPRRPTSLILFLLSLQVLPALAVYTLVKDYSGLSFFNDWKFYEGVDNRTNGNAVFNNRTGAALSQLIYASVDGGIILKVDNTTVVPPSSDAHRNSVRITSDYTFDVGNLLILDLAHIPYGCSVSPSFRLVPEGQVATNGNGIDIISGVNDMDYNQMSLHADAANQSCLKAESSAQLGRVETSAADCSQTMGCAVAETKSDSYGDDFAKAGGGVFALNMDGTGIRIWFWSRNDVPGSIKTANRTTNVDFDLSTWGTPSAAYLATSGCDARQAIVPQHIVFDISLCGSWAGSPEVYNNTCPTKGSCVVDNVIGPGNPVYNDAYFEINYLRAYFLTNATIPAGVSGVSGSSKLSRWILGVHVTIFSLYFVTYRLWP